MKAGQFVLLVIIFILLGAISYLLYSLYLELNAKPVSLISGNYNTSEYIIDDGQLQFYPNMRFSTKTISYKIDELCDRKKTARVKEAFLILERETELKFYESENGEIEIVCNESGEMPKPGEYFIAGEGGPTSVINSSLFNVIESGKVLLFYEKSLCDNPNVELHEILHVLGFKHASNKNSIMYNVLGCEQNLTLEILSEIKKIYSFDSLPDLYFNNVSATKRGSYLDFDTDVRNKGLINAKNVSLNVFKGDNLVKIFELGDLNYGEGKIMSIRNLKVGSNTKEMKFVIIYNKQELEKKNNFITLSVGQD